MNRETKTGKMNGWKDDRLKKVLKEERGRQ
jgi:hypothetical protein